jgi:2-polyprenyl-3-methyl-5-hydroxy-6-metoxy-1,4-benzoquinol methylase
MVASLIAKLPRGLKRRARRWFEGDPDPSLSTGLREIPLTKFLLGDENGVTASALARITGNLSRASTPIERFPHILLLRQYQKIEDRLLEPVIFEQTPYYQNGRECIDLMGHYFEAWNDSDIIKVAKRFMDHFNGATPAAELHEGQSDPGKPIHVRPIRLSDCYQVIDGHHRLALAQVRGQATIPVYVEPPPVLTPLQSLLLDVQWTQGDRWLHQPIDAPELKHSWIQTRKCTDRFAKMRGFLESNHLLPPTARTYLDIGCAFGWFVAQMSALGFDSHGVELDPIAPMVGQSLYALEPKHFFRTDCVRFLQTTHEKFDVASCCSLMHHFALGEESVSAETLIHLIDRVIGKVLFFDTGQSNEAWFKTRLPDWSPDFIQNWLKKNTTFAKIIPLGADEDAVHPFADNYGRMLFACVR